MVHYIDTQYPRGLYKVTSCSSSQPKVCSIACTAYRLKQVISNSSKTATLLVTAED